MVEFGAQSSKQATQQHGSVAVLGDAEGSPAGARGVVQQHGGSVRAQAVAPAHTEAGAVRGAHSLPGMAMAWRGMAWCGRFLVGWAVIVH